MPRISIIIPNYNNSKYLNRCIKSAINQIYEDIEIICVDDKSTDNSLEILNEYAKIHSNFKLIALEKNGGVSNARNEALKICTGDYVCFLDSDDFLELTSCKDLYEAMINTSSDLACGGHIKVNANNQRISKWLPKKEISTNPLEDIYDFTKHRNVTQKLFKMSIIRENNLIFDKSLNYMEDALFLVNYLKHCKVISGVKKILYNVQINFDSLCRNTKFKERRKRDAEEAMTKMSDK